MQTSFSVAQSFMATLVGIAIDEKLLAGRDEPVTTYIPELLEREARIGDITIQDLLTMSSGLSFDERLSPWADPPNYHGTDLRTAVITKPTSAGPPGTDLLQRMECDPARPRLRTRHWNVCHRLHRKPAMEAHGRRSRRLVEP